MIKSHRKDDEMTDDTSGDVLRNAIKGLLRPIVRLCLSNAIKLSDVVELLKQVFVEVGREELAQKNQEISGSRISVMTGVHRKDVARIQSEGAELKQPENIISKIMVQWQHDKEFTTKAGKPRVLTAVGSKSEFAKLVESVNGNNVSPYTVLFEMERLGIVKKKGGRVTLEWRDYISSESEAEGLQMLVEDSQDLISAVTENIYEASETNNLHLKTEYDKIPVSQVPIIRKWLIEEGSRFHLKVKRFLAKYDADFNKNICINDGEEESYVRAAMGTFSFVTPTQMKKGGEGDSEI